MSRCSRRWPLSINFEVVEFCSNAIAVRFHLGLDRRTPHPGQLAADPLLRQSWQSRSVFNKSSAAAYHYQIIDAIESLPNLFYLAHRTRYPRAPTDSAAPPRNRALIGDSPPPLH
jgi:hypothetical protein